MTPYRTLVEGAIYRLRTGIAWRDLPAEFGPWQTVWKRHARFSKDGTWGKVLLALTSYADSLHRLAGATNITAACRRVSRHPNRVIALLG